MPTQLIYRQDSLHHSMMTFLQVYEPFYGYDWRTDADRLHSCEHEYVRGCVTRLCNHNVLVYVRRV